jgi:hypothetical protein
MFCMLIYAFRNELFLDKADRYRFGRSCTMQLELKTNDMQSSILTDPATNPNDPTHSPFTT